MKTVLVTGATGLIGSNACVQLLERGDRVRTIARKPDAADARALAKIGVEVLPGDILDRAVVAKAVDGVDGIIHSAALRGIPGTNNENSFGPNTIGAMHVLSAAWIAGNIPVVQLLTHTFFEIFTAITENSPLDKEYRNADPYSTTKRLAYAEAIARIRDGQDIRFMVPGAVYGPTPCLENGMFHPSYNSRIQRGIRGELDAQMPRRIAPVTGGDCAFVCVAALDRGVAGQRYIAMGRQQDAMTIADMCNIAAEYVSSPHRVETVPRERLNDADVVAKYGATVTSLARLTYPDPLFDTSLTERQLGYAPTPIKAGVEATVDWMRANKVI